MTKLTIYLETDEHLALDELARKERRGLREQAAQLVTQQLRAAGLLPDEGTAVWVNVPPAQGRTYANANPTT